MRRKTLLTCGDEALGNVFSFVPAVPLILVNRWAYREFLPFAREYVWQIFMGAEIGLEDIRDARSLFSLTPVNDTRVDRILKAARSEGDNLLMDMKTFAAVVECQLLLNDIFRKNRRGLQRIFTMRALLDVLFAAATRTLRPPWFDLSRCAESSNTNTLRQYTSADERLDMINSLPFLQMLWRQRDCDVITGCEVLEIFLIMQDPGDFAAWQLLTYRLDAD